jgi:hypothetical protein
MRSAKILIADRPTYTWAGVQSESNVFLISIIYYGKKKDNGYYELPNWLATDALDLLMMELSWRGDGEREPPLGFRPRY